jgi:teichuronic acid biosynthesis glycosyltransferase TuaC
MGTAVPVSGRESSVRILTYTTLFPNPGDRNLGVFVRNRLIHFARQYHHELQVVAPVPYFPNLRLLPRWHQYAQIPRREENESVPVYHPRFLVTPKVGMTFYGWNMLWGSWRTVRRIQREFDFDVIDAHYIYPDAFAAILLGRLLGKPVVVSARGTDINLYARMAAIRPLLRYVLRRSTAIIAVCQALKDGMIDLGVSAEKIHVIGNGVDSSAFHPLAMASARQQLGLPLEKKIILSVGQLIERKGVHHLVEALAKLASWRDDVQLVLVGSHHDAAYVKRIKEQVARLRLGQSVCFAGPQPHSVLRTWYSACDLLCLASSREGWPNVLLEAMACGKPVVASSVWGIPEVVCSPEYGILVDRVDGEGFAAAMQQTLEKKWDTERIVRYARLNSWERASAKQQSLFQGVLAGTRRQARTVAERLSAERSEGGHAN